MPCGARKQKPPDGRAAQYRQRTKWNLAVWAASLGWFDAIRGSTSDVRYAASGRKLGTAGYIKTPAAYVIAGDRLPTGCESSKREIVNINATSGVVSDDAVVL